MDFMRVETKKRNYFFIDGKRTKEDNFFLQRVYLETKKQYPIVKVSEKNNIKHVVWSY